MQTNSFHTPNKTTWSCLSIPKHSMLSGEPRECSIDIQTDKVIHTGVMFLPELA
jgi:hypothetical protein